MTRPTIPTVTIELDKPRRLKFDFNAAARFEQATGKNLLSGATLGAMSATDIRAFLWACLAWGEDKSLTLDEVGELVDFTNMAEVGDKLAQVFNRNTPEGGDNPRPLA